MTGSERLGGYDMALALSQTTINYQFKQLHKRNIIHKSWGVLMGNVLKPEAGKKAVFLNEDSSDFKPKLSNWQKQQKALAKAVADKNQEEANRLRTEIVNQGLDFDLGWNASIDQPRIEILKGETQNLSLLIAFKSGKLYYRASQNAEVQAFDLKNCVYAFKVPVGQLKIKKDQMVLEAGTAMDQVIKENHLSEKDFTIESLFLDFENANIARFDKDRSQLPAELAEPAAEAVKHYFTSYLQSSDRKFILGYGVSRRDIKTDGEAMFQPTAVGFSTSYSAKQDPEKVIPGKYSGFNFLMMLNNNKPPTGDKSGVLPSSLIELKKDSTSTINGVFGIQNPHFAKYLYSMDQYIEGVFKGIDGMKITQSFSGRTMKAQKYFKHKDDTIDCDFEIRREPLQNLPDFSGIRIRYKIDINVRVGIHIGKDWEIYHCYISTSGKFTKGKIDKKGSPGLLDFTVKAGKEGRFDLINKVTEPNLAYDEDPNLFSGAFWKVLLNIITLIISWPIEVVIGIVNKIAVDLARNSAISSRDLIGNLKNIDVLTQSNKVVLPLGKVYTFKNLRHLLDEGIVAYDIAYAPVEE